MTDTWVVRITPEGDVLTLWHDALDLTDLGHCTVERVSNVEYVEDGWELTWARDGLPMTPERYAKRAEALAEEQRIMFERLRRAPLW